MHDAIAIDLPLGNRVGGARLCGNKEQHRDGGLSEGELVVVEVASYFNSFNLGRKVFSSVDRGSKRKKRGKNGAS